MCTIIIQGIPLPVLRKVSMGYYTFLHQNLKLQISIHPNRWHPPELMYCISPRTATE